MASIPVAAVMCGGKPKVSSASNSATSGKSLGETTPFFSLSLTVTIEIVVTSEPVPAVVGTKIRGSRGPLAMPMPYTSANFSFPGAKSATNLATSIELPPPKPTMKSALHS